MWNPKLDVVVLISSVCFVWMSLPRTCSSMPLAGHSHSTSNSPSTILNTQQWQSLIREALKLIQKQNPQPAIEHKPKIRYAVDPNFVGGGNGGNIVVGGSGSGANAGVSNGNAMMKHRNIRSGFGDMANAFRLYQLHELEKEWASKARPRFGKRAEVTQDNFLPSYMDESDDDYPPPDVKVGSSSPDEFAADEYSINFL